MTKVINICGIDIIIEKKKIKNMYLRIMPDTSVKVTAPIRMPDEDIEKFILQKQGWICERQKEFARKETMAEKQYIRGEMHYLWGREYELEILFSDGECEVWVQDDKIYMKVRKKSTMEERRQILERWYRNVLVLKVKTVMQECVQIVGKTPTEWHIKNMKTRWGTCNVDKKRIWLNLQLVKQPEECLEYVIIHELAHLYEKSHNAVFKAYMDQFCPDWRKTKKKLRIEL